MSSVAEQRRTRLPWLAMPLLGPAILTACAGRDQEIADERQALLSKAEVFRKQLETSGMENTVESLVRAEEAAWVAGEAIYLNQGKTGPVAGYTADLVGKTFDDAHYSPDFWHKIRDLYPHTDYLAVTSVATLNNRLQTHAAFFATTGNSEARQRRWVSWKNINLNPRTSSAGDPGRYSVNEDARITMERANLKWDIALAVMDVQQHAGTNIDEFRRSTDEFISEWIRGQMGSLVLPEGYTKDAFVALVKLDNPFVNR